PPRAGQAIEVDYLNGYVTVRINGTTYIDEQMVSGPAGAAGRFLGIQSRRQAWITWESSPWFGPWSARDLPQDDDGEDGEEGEEEGGEEEPGQSPATSSPATSEPSPATTPWTP